MGLKEQMHIGEIIEERCLGSFDKIVYVCWTSRPNWAWEGQLGLAVTMQDAGVSGAGPYENIEIDEKRAISDTGPVSVMSIEEKGLKL